MARLTHAEALAWLRGQVGQTVSAATIARATGWSRSTAGARLKAWEADGSIATAPAGQHGRTLLSVAAPDTSPDTGSEIDSAAGHPPRAPHEPDTSRPDTRPDALHTLPDWLHTRPEPQRQSLREVISRPVAGGDDYIARLAGRPDTPKPDTGAAAQPPASVPAPVRTPNLPVPVVARTPDQSDTSESDTSTPDTRTAAPPAAPARRIRWDLAIPLAILLGIVAVATMMIWVSTRINIWFVSQKGATPEARTLWSNASLVAEIGEVIFGCAGSWFVYQRQAFAAAWSYMTMGVIFTFTVLASIGFASQNTSDTTTARSDVAAQRQAAEATISRARGELASLPLVAPIATLDARTAAEAAKVGRIEQQLADLPPARLPDVIAAAIQAAQPSVPRRIWRSTDGCTDVTAKASGEACAPLLALRQEKEQAERRQQLDQQLAAARSAHTAAVAERATADRRRDLEKEIAEAQATHAALPDVTSADPQAEAAATIANWLTRGLTSISTLDAQLLFLVLVVLVVKLPVTAAPILVMAILRPRRPRGEAHA